MFESIIRSNKGVEVRRGGSRQIHDEVGKSRREADLNGSGIDLFLGFTGSAETSLHPRFKVVDMAGNSVVQRLRGSRQPVKATYRCGDEFTCINIEGTENPLYLVAPYTFSEGGIRVGVDVICPDNNLLFRCWYRERASAGHDVGNSFTRFKESNDTLVLIFESRIPIYLREIEAEFTVRLGRDDFSVRRAGEELHGESTVGGPGADILYFIDNGGDDRVFVEDEVGKEVLVGEAWDAEVKVGDVADFVDGGRTEVWRENGFNEFI